MKNLEKCKVHSHNKVRTLFAENKVCFARAEQLWLKVYFELVLPTLFILSNLLLTKHFVRIPQVLVLSPCNDYPCYGALEIVGAITIIIIMPTFSAALF